MRFLARFFPVRNAVRASSGVCLRPQVTRIHQVVQAFNQRSSIDWNALWGCVVTHEPIYTARHSTVDDACTCLGWPR